MTQQTISVLLVEDDPVAAGLFHAQLSADFNTRYEFERVSTVRDGLEALERAKFDVAVLDLLLPDARGLDSVREVRSTAPHLPIVVLSGLDDEALAVEALSEGAQDYLVKGDLSGRLISRSLRYAIERQRLTETLRGLSLLDEPTGLFNRRGFFILGEPQLKFAQRTGRGAALILVTLGRQGDRPPRDRTLRRVAEILRDTFRGSDLVARLSARRAAVLAIEPHRQGAETALARLRSNLAASREVAGAEAHLEWWDCDRIEPGGLGGWVDEGLAALSRPGAGSRP